MSENILKVENATMQFGGVVAVDNLNLEINQGAVSYTHLDVYKRQVQDTQAACFLHKPAERDGFSGSGSANYTKTSVLHWKTYIH